MPVSRIRRFTLVTALAVLVTALVVPQSAGVSQPTGAATRATAPQIDSVSPGFGSPGDLIEITGRGFDDGGNPPTVTFLSVPAKVQAFTDAAMTVVVPEIPNPPDGFLELLISNPAGSDRAPFRYYPSEQGGELTAPTSLTAKARKGKVILRWSPPASGAVTVVSYQWRFRQKGKGWSAWKTVAKGAQARQQVVKRIRPKKVYTFEVRAVAAGVPGPAATVSARGR